MSVDKLKMKQVLIFKREHWKGLAVRIRKWIWADMRSGKVQEYSGTGYQYTRQYARYKSRNMRRFTDGKRLKAYQGKPIVSDSKTPNMLLTGELIKGLDYVSSDKDSMVMAYKEKDKGKVKGNEEQGRNIRTLNDENMRKTRNYLLKGLQGNIKKWARKRVVINVGATR